MRVPDVEFLWWDGCPSSERALSELRVALTDVGLGRVEIEVREIRTDADADEIGFKGSPTILIDGMDLSSITTGARAVEDEPAGLNCRIYRRRDGTISPTPDPDDLRAALRDATRREPVRR